MDDKQAIAHAAKDKDGKWREPHDLAEHLKEVAILASQFAQFFNGSGWAYLAGLWHDLGKYRLRFQKYIRHVSGFEFELDAHIKGEAGKASHSTAGAVLAIDRFGLPGRVLSYVIASHHAGLYDWNLSLEYRLQQEDSRSELEEALAAYPPADILDSGTFKPDLRNIPGGKDGFALWVRMLFSCLIDADRLDTEAYMDIDKSERRGDWPNIQTLLEQFDQFMANKMLEVEVSQLNSLRADILMQCRAKALDEPGIFSLTVPTGGGKTLSSMAFALDHAKRYDKQRIIYVIPYTSIIEQTADIFRSIFGDAVIEHHSNAEIKPEKEDSKSQLACENWDASIIVTTNVQFFESLFSAKTSRCRKLHNIVNSVVVLDEAQLLPTKFLQPILDVINLLSIHYHVTFVLSTATQPALSSREYFDAKNDVRGLKNVREIMSDPDVLYRALDRVKVTLPKDWDKPVTWVGLAEEMSQRESVLAIVSTRKNARELWQLMPKGTFHLSALMCGEHRSQIIKQIKQQLKNKILTRVVATSLVEAGVDFSFPVVYKSIAGLDSIAQAGGRCNRESELAYGELIVFIAPEPPPKGQMRKAADTCRSVLENHIGHPLERTLFETYFKKLYKDCDLDEEGIVTSLKLDEKNLGVQFRTTSEKFKLIDDEASASVIVRYYGVDGDSKAIDNLISLLKKEGPKRWLLRQLQRYIVNIHQREVDQLVAQGDVKEIIQGLYVQENDFLYTRELGLCLNGILMSVAKLIV